MRGSVARSAKPIKMEVVARIQEGEFAAFPELSYIAGLLAGQEVFIICLNLTPTRAP